MTDLEIIVELKELKKSLVRGDQRTLAARMGCFPTRVSDAFYGLVRDVAFLKRLVAECKKLIAERKAVAVQV